MITFKEYLTELSKPPAIKSFIDVVNQPDGYFGLNSEIIKQVDDISRIHHFEKLGSGMYGVVYKNNTYPYVIKIFKASDHGYRMWLDYCIANKSNPYVPKIKGRPTKITGTDYYFVRLEHLKKISAAEWSKFSFRLKVAANPNRFNKEDIEKATLDPYIIDIVKYLNSAKQYENDLHKDNVMKRDNGQLVITDPLA